MGLPGNLKMHDELQIIYSQIRFACELWNLVVVKGFVEYSFSRPINRTNLSHFYWHKFRRAFHCPSCPDRALEDDAPRNEAEEPSELTNRNGRFTGYD